MPRSSSPSLLKWAGLAASTSARSLFGKEMAIRHLSSHLQDIPGVPAKVGQLLGMKSGTGLPPDLTPQLSPDEVIALLKIQLPSLANAISDLETSPKVASLSQVHRARLKTGEDVAIKVQFPSIRESLAAQLQFAKQMMQKYNPARSYGWEPSEFWAYFQAHLLEELDYQQEASNQQRFFRFTKHNENIIVPSVFAQYSNATILTQSFVESCPVSEAHLWTTEQRERIARTLTAFQLECIFRFGVVHGDLHPGNWGRDKQGRLVLYDFGSIVVLTPQQRHALADLVELARSGQTTGFDSQFIALGFDPSRLEPIAQDLAQIAQLVCEPLVRPTQWDTRKWNLAERLKSLLGDRVWWFRSAGPPWFLSLMRSCQGVFNGLHRLDVKINLELLVNPYFVTSLKQSSTSEPPMETQKQQSAINKTHLKVEIREGHETIVFLEFPAYSVRHLRDMVSPETQDKLAVAGYDLEKVAQDVMASGYQPRELFKSQNGIRTYRVWIE